MGLRCLIGHDYGEPQTAEDREERGNEVVVTVREYTECARCGHRRTLTENKEVTTGHEPEPTPEPAPPEPIEAPDDAYDDLTAEEDDGVILDDTLRPEPERGPGEWPPTPAETAPADDTGDRPPTAWPDADGEDEGFDAESPDDDPASDVTFDAGLAPEATAEAQFAADAPDSSAVATAADDGDGDGGAHSPAGIRSASPSPAPTERQRAVSPDTQLACPECDNAAPALHSSLRPGDICPECHRGYLVEREP